jgi:branched-subunit amino acid aminotransferase/4-amino-4-deoxychorismate lyase
MSSFPNELYGESLFTTTRMSRKGLLFEKKHFERLIFGVESYYLLRRMSPREKDEFSDKVRAQIPEYQNDTIIRLSVALGGREQLLPGEVNLSELIISCTKRAISDLSNSRLTLVQSPFTEHYPDLKMGSYMPHFYFKRQAQSQGYNDALFLLGEQIMSSTTSNVFFIKEGKLITPKKKILSGIIRESLIEMSLAKEEDIKLSDLEKMDGAFLTNSSILVQNISSIEHFRFDENYEILESMRNKLNEFGYE